MSSSVVAALSTDFQCLKARGYKPFFRGATLKYRDGPVICNCARGEANKVVAAAAQAARAAAPPPAKQPRPQRTSVAIDPSSHIALKLQVLLTLPPWQVQQG